MTFKKFFAWVRFILTMLLVLAGLLIIVMNRNHVADVWFFYLFENINVLWLMLITAVTSVVGVWVVSGVHRAWREIRPERKLETQPPANLS